jgi:glucose-1-phosphate thymidylyltransferase
LGRGMAWFDTGTHNSLLDASNFVRTVETRQCLKIACLEEIGLNQGWINLSDVKFSGKLMESTSYGQYLLNIELRV